MLTKTSYDSATKEPESESPNCSLPAKNAELEGQGWTFERDSEIGHGSSCYVYRRRLVLPRCNPVCAKCPPEVCAVKKLHDVPAIPKREPEIMRLLHDEGASSEYQKYLVRYIGSFLPQDGVIHIVMEYMPEKDLQRFAEGYLWDEIDVRIVTEQILSALKFMHGHGVAHRDIKPSNIFPQMKFDQNGNPLLSIKLGDFGCAKLDGPYVTVIGTPKYMAPEVFGEIHSPAVDIWAVGCTLYRLIAGDDLFTDTRQICVYQYTGEPCLKEKLNDRCTTEAIEFTLRLIEVDIGKRASPKEALEDPWLTERGFGNRIMTEGLMEHFHAIQGASEIQT